MKLTDLAPRWCLAARWDDSSGTQHFLNGDTTKRSGMGFSFLCPVHHNHRLVVFFANPIDGLPKAAEVQCTWQRMGDTFETLTLGPSIDASGHQYPLEQSQIETPCWHGSISNGEIQ